MAASVSVATGLTIRGLVFDAPRQMACGGRQRLTRPLRLLAMLVTAGSNVRSVTMSGDELPVAASTCVRTAANLRNYKMKIKKANKITAHNAGWRSQFRFAGCVFLVRHV
jgi:hypothetical protein